MKINKALWDYYSQGDFQSDIEFFSFKGKEFIKKCEEVIPIMLDDAPEEHINDDSVFFAFHDIQVTLDELDIPEIKSRDDFFNFIKELVLYKYDGIDPHSGKLIRDGSNAVFDKDDLRSKCAYIPMLSVYLYARYGWYVPIFYSERYDLFEKYCNSLQIELPDRPAENDYPEAIKFYYDICKAVNSEREKEGLSDEEMAAIIYGYATLLSTEENEIEEKQLPEPRRIWVTCAGIPGKKDSEDFKIVDTFTDGVEYWNCSKLTSPGDVVIIYCVSPRSYIHSIWRAVEEPHLSPFGYRKVRVAVSNKIEIPHISLNDLRADQYMSQCYVVRKNFMGTHGDELSPEDYTNILRMIEDKGGDISMLPKFSHPHEMEGVSIKSEQDVSNQLVVPFLKTLGYGADDFVPELDLQLGRETKAGRPDFTIFQKRDSIYKHQYRAPFVIEVKEDFNEDGFEKVKGQGLSYARYLHSHYFGLADKYSFVLFEEKGNSTYDLDNPVFSEQWSVIYSNSEVYAKILNLIHPDVVRNL